MTASLVLMLRADASDAKSKLAETGAAARKTGAQVEDMGRKGKSAATGTKALSSAADRATVEVAGLAQAERATAATTVSLGRANKLAAGQVGNLTAQFNDVGMMLAAGQNPLQLALQQGTQITQVIGPMGASGAVKALGAAFMQMLNPVSLITIGSIAAGAAMVGWLREAWPAAKSLDDIMGDLSDSTDRYSDAMSRTLLSGDELLAGFGSLGVAAKEQLRWLADLERSKAIDDLDVAGKKLAETFGGLSRTLFLPGPMTGSMLGDFAAAQPEINATMEAIRKEFGLTSNQASLLVNALAEIDQAGTPDDAIAAANLFSDALLSVFGTADKVPAALKEAALAAGEIVIASGKITAADEAEARAAEKKLKTARELMAELDNEIALQALAAAHGKKSAEVYNYQLGIERERYRLKVAELPLAAQLMEAWNKANPERDPFQERIINAGRYYAQTRQQSNLELNAANDLLAKLEDENALHEAIRQHGEKSAEVAALRAQQARRVNEEMLATLGVSESVKDELRKAFEEGLKLEQLDIAEALTPAAQEAERLARALQSAFDTQQFLTRQQFAAEDFLMSLPVAPVGGRPPRKPPRRGGGGTSEADRQKEAIADLIQSQLDELAILRTLDPVQKEMLKNRKALAGATDDQRSLVEALITERIREQAQMDALQESYDFWGETTLGTLDDLILSGNDFNDVMGNLARTLASAALEATILGTGPLASMFGTSGSGGLFGSIFGPLFKAEGGLIHGPGGPTEDRVMTFTSPGEYIVRAAQTAKHLPLLEAINSGAADRLPGFAGGGLVGQSLLMASAPPLLMMQRAARDGGGERSREPARLELHLSGDIEARNIRTSNDVALKVFRDGIEQFSNEGLPHRMKQIASDEKAIG